MRVLLRAGLTAVLTGGLIMGAPAAGARTAHARPAAAPATPASAAAETAPAFVAVPHTRVYDTRVSSKYRLKAFANVPFEVTGRAGIPVHGATAVVLTVTVTRPAARGYLEVRETGSTYPTISNLSFVAGQTISTEVLVGSGHPIAFYNLSAGGLDVIADVAGYVPTAAAGAAGSLTPLPHARILDTRSSFGASRPAGRATASVQALGQAGIPSSGVSGVVLALTVTNATAKGYLTVFPDDEVRPPSSNLNYRPGRSVSGFATVPVGPDGRIALYNGSSDPADLIADVLGYVPSGAATAPGALVPVDPTRVLDTRVSGPALGARATRTVTEPEIDGIPVSGVSAVLVTLTQASATTSGYLTAYASGTSRPGTSELTLQPGATVANQVVVPLGADHRFALYNGSSGTTQLVADVVGVFRSGDGAATGSISGTVRSGYRSYVTVYAGTSYVSSAYTKTDGTYRIDGLADGRYAVCFDPDPLAPTGGNPPYAAECYDDHWGGSEPGTDVTLVPVMSGGLRGGVDATLSASSTPFTMSGRVTGTGAAGVAGVRVSVYNTNFEEQFHQDGAAVTRPDGTYTVTGDSASEGFGANGTAKPRRAVFGVCFDASGATGGPYQSECYDDLDWADLACLFCRADPIVPVYAGRDTGGVDAQLSAPGSITGTVTAAQGGAPVEGVSVTAIGPTGVPVSTLHGGVSAADGRYVITHLRAGTAYRLCTSVQGSARPMPPTEYVPEQCTAAPVVATTSGAEAALRLTTGGAISGTVHFGSGPPPGTFSVRVIDPAHPDVQLGGSNLHYDDGRYEVRGLPASTTGYDVCVDVNSGPNPGRCYRDTAWTEGDPPPAAATEVPVSAGATATGIDITVTP